MVRHLDENLRKAIECTRYRIKFAEKNGIGKSAMEEKEILKKQLRQQELSKQ